MNKLLSSNNIISIAAAAAASTTIEFMRKLKLMRSSLTTLLISCWCCFCWRYGHLESNVPMTCFALLCFALLCFDYFCQLKTLNTAAAHIKHIIGIIVREKQWQTTTSNAKKEQNGKIAESMRGKWINKINVVDDKEFAFLSLSLICGFLQSCKLINPLRKMQSMRSIDFSLIFSYSLLIWQTLEM